MVKVDLFQCNFFLYQEKKVLTSYDSPQYSGFLVRPQTSDRSMLLLPENVHIVTKQISKQLKSTEK